MIGLAAGAAIGFGDQRTDKVSRALYLIVILADLPSQYDDLGMATLPAPFQSDGGVIYNGFTFAANTQPALAGVRTRSPQTPPSTTPLTNPLCSTRPA